MKFRLVEDVESGHQKLDEEERHHDPLDDGRKILRGTTSRLKGLVGDAYKGGEEVNLTITQLLSNLISEKSEPFELHHFNLNHSDNRLSNLYFIPRSLHRKLRGNSVWGKVALELADEHQIDIHTAENRDKLLDLIKLDGHKIYDLYIKYAHELLGDYPSLDRMLTCNIKQRI